MLLSITYYARQRVAELRIDNVIQFPDSYCLGLGREGYLDNDYAFLKECLTILRIL